MTARYQKITVAVVVILAAVLLIVAIVANRYRDAIALEVANSALGDTDITVTDVSVRSIGADFVHFDEIVLALANGTTVLIEGVSLPVKLGSFDGSTMHIERVTILYGDADTSPPQFASALQSYLAAPATLPGGTVAIDELLLPDLPPIDDVAWHADELNPALHASVRDFDLFLTMTPQGAGDYRASFRVLTRDDIEAIMLNFTIRKRMAADYQLEGTLALRVQPLLPVLRALEVVPEDVRDMTAVLAGTFETEVSDELPVFVGVELEPLSALQVDYDAGDETLFHLAVTDSGPVGATFEYPSLDWSAAVNAVELLVDTGEFDALPVRLRNVRCRSGVRCNSAARIDLQQISLGALSIEQLSWSAESMQLTSDDGRWQVRSDNVKVSLRDTTVAGRQFVAPLTSAEISASNDAVSAALRFSTPEGGFTGRAELRHSLARGTGEIRFSNTALDFNILNLSEAVADLPSEFEVSSGYWRIDAEVNWAVTDEGFAYTGTTSHNLDALAGNYGDIGFVGLNGNFEVKIDWQAEPSLSPAQFEVALVDVGFPIRELRGRVTADVALLAADVESVSMAVLGGNVVADPFRYEHTAEVNHLMLRATEIQLPLMVGLADLDAVEISGSVSGDIPVTLRNRKVIIDRGLLENDPPGGVIRYGAETGVTDDQSQLGIVTRSLRNFEYDVLTSEVNYTDSGDLKLQMRLTGTNPDVDPNQPIVLNLGIENNVPQMLRSLQATRSIEDVLEKRLGK